MLLTCHLSSPPVWSELPQDGEAATLRALHGPQVQQTCAVHRLLPLGRAWLRAAAMLGSGASSGLVPLLPITTAASTTAAATGSRPQPQQQPRRAGCGTMMMDPMCDAGVRSNDDYWVMRIFYFPDFHTRFLIGSDYYYWIILSSIPKMRIDYGAQWVGSGSAPVSPAGCHGGGEKPHAVSRRGGFARRSCE